jgi:hypothetical protein
MSDPSTLPPPETPPGVPPPKTPPPEGPLLVIPPPKDNERNPFYYFYLWGLDLDNTILISAAKGFVVWLAINRKYYVNWQSTDAYDALMATKVPLETINSVQNQAAVLECYPVEHLDDDIVHNYRRMVGEGRARGLDMDPASAFSMFAKAQEYILARGQEVARVWYLSATGLTTLIFAVVLNYAWLHSGAIKAAYGENAYYILLGACGGAFGAFFSILSRVGSTPLDPSAGRLLHWLEGVGRILVGVFGAIFAQLAVNLHLLLPILSEKGHIGLFMIGMVAGASERLVPTLIESVEMDASKINTPSSDSKASAAPADKKPVSKKTG